MFSCTSVQEKRCKGKFTKHTKSLSVQLCYTYYRIQQTQMYHNENGVVKK